MSKRRFHITKEYHEWKEYHLEFNPANTGDPEQDKMLDAITIGTLIEAEENNEDYKDGGLYPDHGDLTIVEVDENDVPLWKKED